MLLLITDTSGKSGSIALAQAEEGSARGVELIEAVPLAGGTFSAQLVAQIAVLLAKHGFGKGDIGAFIGASGPGSFTGLRVGLAAIKALAEILHKPIVPVSLLEVVAIASGCSGTIMAALDAGRGEVYAGEYELAQNKAWLCSQKLLSKSEFLSVARRTVVATPDTVMTEALRNAGVTVIGVPQPEAEMIAQLGWKKLQADEIVMPEYLEANYIRRSDAEIFAKPGR